VSAMIRMRSLWLAGVAIVAGCNGVIGVEAVPPADGGSTQDGRVDGEGPDGGRRDGNGGKDTGSDGRTDGARDGRTGDGGGGCTIDGTRYAAGEVNPGNACAVCEPAMSTTGWANAPDGNSCGTGQICHAGGCLSGCEIGGAFYAMNAVNPTNPCQACEPAMRTKAWSDIADNTPCGNGQVCGQGECGTGCMIGGTLYGSGVANSMNACETCQPGTSTSAWTDFADGASCGSGKVCSTVSGVVTCGAGCYIGGIFYASGTANPGNVCLWCEPKMSTTVTTAWGNVADGLTCGTGDVCHAGGCGAGCFIGGTLYLAATVNSSNACESCQPGTSTTVWSDVAEGTGCGSGDFCNGAACTAGCFIGGVFYASATPESGNSCQSCQPTTSKTSWTAATDGTGCGNSQVCSSGQCGTTCDIGGSSYASGAINSANTCQSCQPGTNGTMWSSLADGTSCGPGEVCDGVSCASGCFIGGTFYAASAVSSNGCQSCQPGTSTTAWSNVATGTSCGTDDVCNAGSCGSGCFIGGAVYAPGATNPSSVGCQSCEPMTSTTAWTDVATGTYCGSGEVCDLGSCSVGCGIGGTYYAPSTQEPGNVCASCQPGTTTASWTEQSDGTACASGEICHSGACQTGCEIGGMFFGANTTNSANSCQSCQPFMSTSAWSSNANGTSCGTGGSVCSNGTCGSTECVIGGASYPPGTPNPGNACQFCKPGMSTTTWSNLTDGTSCPPDGVCSSGTCEMECFIAGKLVPVGTLNGSNMCQSCQPPTSTFMWTNVPDGKYCNANEFCSGGTCVSGCEILGMFYAPGATNPANPCQSCQPPNTTSWSNQSGPQNCGGRTGSGDGGGGCACTGVPDAGGD
jgi:hypothetical protein